MGVIRIAGVLLATYTLLSHLRYACIGCFLGNIYTMASMLHVHCPVGNIYLTTTFMFHVRYFFGNLSLSHTDTLCTTSKGENPARLEFHDKQLAPK